MLRIIILACFLCSSCAMKFTAVNKPELKDQCLQKIARYNQQVYQIKSTLDIKAYGFLGNFFHEQADIVIQKPAFLYWSLRSFFGTPSMILTSNGHNINLLDYSNNGSIQQWPLRANSLIEVMDFIVHPQSLISIFLAQIPLDGATNIHLAQKGQLLQIITDKKDGWHITAIFDTKTDKIVKTSLTNKNNNINYEAQYFHHEKIQGIYFPKKLVLSVQDRSKKAKLTITLDNLLLNGEPVPSEIFDLKSY